MNKVLLDLGFIEIRWYSIIMLFAILSASYVFLFAIFSLLLLLPVSFQKFDLIPSDTDCLMAYFFILSRISITFQYLFLHFANICSFLYYCSLSCFAILSVHSAESLQALPLHFSFLLLY